MCSNRRILLIALVATLAPQTATAVQTRTAGSLNNAIVVQVDAPAGARSAGDFTASLVELPLEDLVDLGDGSLGFPGLRPRRYTVELAGLPAGCAAEGSNSQTVQLGETGRDTVSFVVRCTVVDTTATPPPPDRPTASVSPEAATIVLGDSVWLSFRAEGGESGTIRADTTVIMELPAMDASAGVFSFRWPVAPQRTTKYVLEVAGPGGVARAIGTVHVPPAPRTRVSASLAEGDSALVLRLLTQGADRADLRSSSDPRLRLPFAMRPEAVFADSAVVAVPGVTTTYDFTASGPGGVDSTSTAVAVLRETVLDTIVPVSFELGLSGVGVVAGAARLGVPTLSAAAAWSNWHLELRGGLRPRGASGPDPLSPVDPRPQFGDRTQKLVSLSVAYFPTAWRGASPGAVSAGVGLSYVAGWETVRELDQFMIRAHGPAVGPRFRLRRGLWSFGGGLDLQYAHVTEFDEPVSRWEFGVIPSITFTYVFD